MRCIYGPQWSVMIRHWMRRRLSHGAGGCSLFFERHGEHLCCSALILCKYEEPGVGDLTVYRTRYTRRHRVQHTYRKNGCTDIGMGNGWVCYERGDREKPVVEHDLKNLRDICRNSAFPFRLDKEASVHSSSLLDRARDPYEPIRSLSSTSSPHHDTRGHV